VFIGNGASESLHLRAADDGDAVDVVVTLENGGVACWVTAVTTPIVAPVTPPPCGNYRLDAGEQCDEGFPANGSARSCCSRRCTFRAAGDVCRPSAGACDAADACTGQSAECPDRHAPDTTSCDDGDRCNGIETCQSGRCIAATPLDCRTVDNNPCSYNPCDPQVGCQVAPLGIPGCDPARVREAFVGGPTNECRNGTVAASGDCVVSAGSTTVRIPPNALRVPTAITVAPIDLQGCPACGAGSWSLLDPGPGRIVSCTRLMPEGLTFDVPVTLEFGWNAVACEARFACPRMGVFEEGRMEVRRGTTRLVERCGAASNCPPSATSHACLDPATCCGSATSCGTKDAVCDPGRNTWTLRRVRQF
jgi:hypothetical protein